MCLKEEELMADIIKFQQYVNAKDEEKRRIKQVSLLSTKSKNIEGLLHNISNSVGCSFVTKHFGEMNQIVGKENILDPAMLEAIINFLKDYNSKICEQIKELSGYDTKVTISY